MYLKHNLMSYDTVTGYFVRLEAYALVVGERYEINAETLDLKRPAQ